MSYRMKSWKLFNWQLIEIKTGWRITTPFISSINEMCSFLKTGGEANEFASNNSSDFDHYNVIYADSVVNLFRQIPYGESITDLASNPNANGLYSKDGNAFTDALIDHIEIQSIQ